MAIERKIKSEKIKDLLIKVDNPMSPLGISEKKREREYVLEDVLQSLITVNKINTTMNNDNNAVNHSTTCSTINNDEVSNEISRFFDIELSNKKQKKAQKLLLENRGMKLLSRKSLDKLSISCSCVGFKIKWIQSKKENTEIVMRSKRKTLVLG